MTNSQIAGILVKISFFLYHNLPVVYLNGGRNSIIGLYQAEEEWEIIMVKYHEVIIEILAEGKTKTGFYISSNFEIGPILNAIDDVSA